MSSRVVGFARLSHCEGVIRVERMLPSKSKPSNHALVSQPHNFTSTCVACLTPLFSLPQKIHDATATIDTYHHETKNAPLVWNLFCPCFDGIRLFRCSSVTATMGHHRPQVIIHTKETQEWSLTTVSRGRISTFIGD